MCENASQPVSNLIAEARGVLNRNRGRWPEADWQTLDKFVSEIESFVDDMIQFLADEVAEVCGVPGLGAVADLIRAVLMGDAE
ncbi:hypothetical protein [Mycolicibacterium houstonense]|uniref:hypothetical protein n=1 Tax=Mycolicibacterium houstonense TaxID=146021 RepID=UPI00082DB053|nr:hypothetical protein [Mycolicibacterium houstonense]